MKPLLGHLLGCLLLVMAGGLYAQDQTSPQPTVVVAETFQPAKPAPRQSALKVRPLSLALRTRQPLPRPMSMTLGEPGAGELQALQQNQGRRKAFQVGIRRDVPAVPEVVDWVWLNVSGGQAGHFTLTSLGAARVRSLIQLGQDLPAGVEIRIYRPDAVDEVYGPFTQADFRQPSGTQKPGLWTPTVEGDSLGIEVFAPTGISPGQIKLSLPALSHIVYDMRTGQLKGLSTQKFASCDVSLACAPAAWQQTGKGVARYIFTDQSGSSFMCTGTLLADQDSRSQIPYFITAAHCVADETSAASMDLYWFYRESSCGSGDSTWVQTQGGASLLSTQVGLDGTLVRLNTEPPAGVVLSGWSLDGLQAGQPIAGIHHGLGNPKQYSEGVFANHVRITAASGGYNVYNDPAGDFTQVVWSQGITAQGSSGSGLWREVNGQHYLKGTLVGGSSACYDPASPDEYTRLEKFHPYISTWLDAQGGPVMSLLDESKPFSSLVDGILAARYMQGTRGAALLAGVTGQPMDITLLENRLDLLQQHLDIDADGLIGANKDGLLLIRYLGGLRGDALTAGMDLAASARGNPSVIVAYLDGLFI